MKNHSNGRSMGTTTTKTEYSQNYGKSVVTLWLQYGSIIKGVWL